MSKLTFPRKLLLPLVPAYRLALTLRELRLGSRFEPVRRLRWPVVSIGNLSTGGAGKTPLTIALAKALTRRGLPVDVLSRGYGRRSLRPARVDPDGTAEEFGDEPLLIARQTGVPVYVARQRYEAGLLAEAEQSLAEKSSGLPDQSYSSDTNPAKSVGTQSAAEKLNSKSVLYQGTTLVVPQMQQKAPWALAPAASIHLLDDGFQHRQLHRDIDILLLDGRDWHQESLLPAGNLREPLEAARRATVIAIPAGEGAPELEAAQRAWGWQGPVWRLHRKMEIPAIDGPVSAFCGIARPEQFFAGLEAAGLRIAARLAFPDHHRYTAADLQHLVNSARATGAAALITTEKDQVRLGKLSSAFPESLPLMTAGLRIEIEHDDEAIEWLVDRLSSVPLYPPL